MSAFPDTAIRAAIVPPRVMSPTQFALLSILLAVLGLSTIWPTVLYFWSLWTTDSLQSVGICAPLVSLILILREWKKLGWRTEASWWGLALLVTVIVAVRVGDQEMMIVVISAKRSIVLPPPQLVVFMYGSSVVLLLAGTKLYRKAFFPIVILFLVNPVPHVFYPYVDLPLQHISAHLARTFAMMLGQSLTADQLSLMFTPQFGMFIAPGCNGVRGAVVMGFIALISGYVYRFRWHAHALVVLGAILLGYVFNLVRLCVLVLYYVVALHLPGFQSMAENADYVIGAGLFFTATLLLFKVIFHFKTASTLEEVVPTEGVRDPRVAQSNLAPLVAMAVVTTFGCFTLARAELASSSSHHMLAGASAQSFPARFGNYTLARSWNETLLTGPIVYAWGEYIPAGGGIPIAIGVSPGPGWHNPIDCHLARGEKPDWQRAMRVSTADVSPVRLSFALYGDGATRYLEASTFCGIGSCGEYSTENSHFGFIFSPPKPRSLFSKDGPQFIALLLRTEPIEMPDATIPTTEELTRAMQKFLVNVPLSDFAKPYRR